MKGEILMLFKTTDAHEKFRAKVRNFAEAEFGPDTFSRDQEGVFPAEAVKKMAVLGLTGIPYPPEAGGAGLDTLSYAIAVEELSRVDGSAGDIIAAHTSLGTYPVAVFGTEEQKQKYLPALTKGEKLGAFALTETGAGSDVNELETTAAAEEDHYILNGSKIYVTNAPYADIYTVFAVTSEEEGEKKISAFIVEKGMEGFEIGETYNKMGIRSSSAAELLFNDVKVPKENLLGEEGAGAEIADETLNANRIAVGAQALGIAQGAFDKTKDYALERKQAGMPIAFSQINQIKFADMAIALKNARLQVYSAAELKDSGEDYAAEAAMAKACASGAAIEVCDHALEITGAAGYMKGMDVERAYRDARITTIYEGASELQKLAVAEGILGKPPVPEEELPEEPQEAAEEAETAVEETPADTFKGKRKKIIFAEGTAQERVDQAAAALTADGFKFNITADPWSKISDAGRVAAVGKGIGKKENMKLIVDLALQTGAAVGATRPVAETLKYVDMDRFIGISGQRFSGELYFACGISGSGQHLKGISDDAVIVAVNNDINAPIFKNADYGIVGDIEEILPLLIKALETGEAKITAEQLAEQRAKAAAAENPAEDQDAESAETAEEPVVMASYVCDGCGYEYDPQTGDPECGIPAGTAFEKLPEEWICPLCGEGRDAFVEVEQVR